MNRRMFLGAVVAAPVAAVMPAAKPLKYAVGMDCSGPRLAVAVVPSIVGTLGAYTGYSTGAVAGGLLFSKRAPVTG